MPSSPSRRLCVLLVDDNPADCDLATEAFGALDSQVNIKVIQDGQAALDWLRVQAEGDALPDVVILDVNMPGLSGLDVLKIIREDAAFRHLPVVMLSTSDRVEDVDRAYDLIASSYLVKQPSFADFARQVEAFVQYWQESRFKSRRSDA